MTLVKGAILLKLVLTDATLGNSTPLTVEEKLQLHWGFDEGDVPQILPNPSYKGLDVKSNLTYVTYTKFNPNVDHIYNPDLKPGRVYVGRSRGFDHPCKIVRIRDYGHPNLNGRGYQQAKLDTYVPATMSVANRHLDKSYWFLRGRENKVIRELGEPLGRLVDQQDATRTNIEFNEETRSACAIWGIAPLTSAFIKKISKPASKTLKQMILAVEALSLIHPEQPHLNWDGVAVEICQ